MKIKTEITNSHSVVNLYTEPGTGKRGVNIYTPKGDITLIVDLKAADKLAKYFAMLGTTK